jgi:hypothetical protein
MRLVHDGKSRTQHGSGVGQRAGDTGGTPGKRTLTESLEPATATPAAGALPPAVQAKMERSFGADFSAVRVHEGQEAPAMGALAYTRGTDIHFAPGQYDPQSQRGQELIGHELAHVVQKSEGRVATTAQAKGVAVNDDPSLEAEADELGARAARGEPVRAGGAAIEAGHGPVQHKAAGVVQMAALTSHWGRFIDSAYTKTANGAHMELDFEPGANTDATKIGLTQSVKISAGGAPLANDPTRANRMVSGGPGDGYFLDRLSTRNNPIYGTPSLAAGKGLADSPETNAPTGAPPSASNATFVVGHHVAKPTGGFDTKNAWLSDTPERNPANDSSMEFETTATAIAGAQTGSYYGSVRWGWRRDGSGKLDLIPFSLVSQGVPSQNFLAAAGAWNAAAATGTLVAKNAPTQCYKWSGGFATDYTIARGVKVTQNSTVGAGTDEYANVTIVDGAKAGSATFVKVRDLTDQGDGPATADLPVPDVHTIDAAGVELNKGVPGPWRHRDPLPRGTRVVPTPTNTRTIPPDPGPGPDIAAIWVEVCDGPLIGHAGYVPRPAVKDERP